MEFLDGKSTRNWEMQQSLEKLQEHLKRNTITYESQITLLEKFRKKLVLEYKDQARSNIINTLVHFILYQDHPNQIIGKICTDDWPYDIGKEVLQALMENNKLNLHQCLIANKDTDTRKCILDNARTACNGLSKENLFSFIHYNVFIEVFKSNDRTVQELLSDFVLSYQNSVGIWQCSAVEQKKAIDFFNVRCLPIIETRKNEHVTGWQWLCMFSMKYFEKLLYSEINILNEILSYVECGFKGRLEDKLLSYDCWKVLIDIISLDSKHLCHVKYLKLLVKPLKVQLSRNNEVICKRLEVWIHFLKVLKDNVTFCLNDFMKFCYQQVNFKENGQPEWSTVVRNTWPTRTSVLIDLIGHSCNSCNCNLSVVLDLTSPIINSGNILKYNEDILNAVAVCSENILYWELKSMRESKIKCIWGSLFKILSSKNLSTLSKEIILKNIYFILEKFFIKSSYNIDYFDDIIQSSFKIIIALDEGSIDNVLLNEIIVQPLTEVMIQCDKLPEYQIVCLIDLIKSCNKLQNRIKYFNNWVDIFKKLNKHNVLLVYLWTNLSIELLRICRTPKIEYDSFKKSSLYFMTWICQYDLPTNLCDKILENWKNVIFEINAISNTFKDQLIETIGKNLKRNPSGAVSLLDFLPCAIDMLRENCTFNYVRYLLDLVLECFKNPCLPNTKVVKLLPIIPRLQIHVTKNGDESKIIASKLFLCVEHFLKPYQVYEALKLFKATLSKFPPALKKFDYSLIRVVTDLTAHLDGLIAHDAISLLAELDRKDCTDKPVSVPAVSSRTARIASLTKTGGMFAQEVADSPVPVKGSYVNKPTAKSPRRSKVANAMPKFQRSPKSNVDDADGSGFVLIDNLVRFDKSKLSARQKEALSERRSDIPALYQDLSQSQSGEPSNSESSKEAFCDVNKNISGAVVDEVKNKIEVSRLSYTQNEVIDRKDEEIDKTEFLQKETDKMESQKKEIERESDDISKKVIQFNSISNGDRFPLSRTLNGLDLAINSESSQMKSRRKRIDPVLAINPGGDADLSNVEVRAKRKRRVKTLPDDFVASYDSDEDTGVDKKSKVAENASARSIADCKSTHSVSDCDITTEIDTSALKMDTDALKVDTSVLKVDNSVLMKGNARKSTEKSPNVNTATVDESNKKSAVVSRELNRLKMNINNVEDYVTPTKTRRSARTQNYAEFETTNEDENVKRINRNDKDDVRTPAVVTNDLSLTLNDRNKKSEAEHKSKSMMLKHLTMDIVNAEEYHNLPSTRRKKLSNELSSADSSDCNLSQSSDLASECLLSDNKNYNLRRNRKSSTSHENVSPNRPHFECNDSLTMVLPTQPTNDVISRITLTRISQDELNKKTDPVVNTDSPKEPLATLIDSSNDSTQDLMITQKPSTVTISPKNKSFDEKPDDYASNSSPEKKIDASQGMKKRGRPKKVTKQYEGNSNSFTENPQASVNLNESRDKPKKKRGRKPKTTTKEGSLGEITNEESITCGTSSMSLFVENKNGDHKGEGDDKEKSEKSARKSNLKQNREHLEDIRACELTHEENLVKNGKLSAENSKDDEIDLDNSPTQCSIQILQVITLNDSSTQCSIDSSRTTDPVKTRQSPKNDQQNIETCSDFNLHFTSDEIADQSIIESSEKQSELILLKNAAGSSEKKASSNQKIKSVGSNKKKKSKDLLSKTTVKSGLIDSNITTVKKSHGQQTVTKSLKVDEAAEESFTADGSKVVESILNESDNTQISIQASVTSQSDDRNRIEDENNETEILQSNNQRSPLISITIIDDKSDQMSEVVEIDTENDQNVSSSKPLTVNDDDYILLENCDLDFEENNQEPKEIEEIDLTTASCDPDEDVSLIQHIRRNLFEHFDMDALSELDRNNLPSSPNNDDDSDRKSEFLNSTMDISPIKTDNATPSRRKDEPKNLMRSPSSRSERLLNMIPTVNLVRFNTPTCDKKNVKAVNLRKNDEEVTPAKEVLEFKRTLPSPYATPTGGSILKRKAEDSGLSPAAKRKRVNFSDPPTTCEKIYFKENDEKDTDDGDVVVSQLNVKRSVPIYPRLLNCTIDVREVLKHFKYQQLSEEKLYEQFKAIDVTTIGDLSRLNSSQVNQFVFLNNPKLTTVINALTTFAGELISNQPADEPSDGVDSNAASEEVFSQDAYDGVVQKWLQFTSTLTKNELNHLCNYIKKTY